MLQDYPDALFFFAANSLTRLAQKDNLTAVCFSEPLKNLDYGGLPCTISSEQSKDLTPKTVERNPSTAFTGP